MYNDMAEVPTFFYFLPLWAFLFGYYAVTKSQLEEQNENGAPTTLNEILAGLQSRVDKLEKKGAVTGNPIKEDNIIMNLAF